MMDPPEETYTVTTWTFFANPGNEKDVDLRGLANSARESFALVEHWKQTQISSKHVVVDSVVVRVVNETQQYYQAITASVDAADEGFAFANDAMDFCGRLARATESPEQLAIGLREMTQMATKAHSGSLEMNVKFRAVRGNMFEILREIPLQIENLKDGNFKTAPEDSNPLLISAAPTPANNTSSSEPPPPYDGFEPTDTGPQEDHKLLQDVFVQLQKVSEDLGTLIQHVGSFVDWWGDMKQALNHLERVIPRMKPDGSNPFRTENVTDRWKNIRNDYALYRKQISEVQDFYTDLAPGTKGPRELSADTPRDRKDTGESQYADAPELLEVPQGAVNAGQTPAVDSEADGSLRPVTSLDEDLVLAGHAERARQSQPTEKMLNAEDEQRDQRSNHPGALKAATSIDRQSPEDLTANIPPKSQAGEERVQALQEHSLATVEEETSSILMDSQLQPAVVEAREKERLANEMEKKRLSEGASPRATKETEDGQLKRRAREQRLSTFTRAQEDKRLVEERQRIANEAARLDEEIRQRALAEKLRKDARIAAELEEERLEMQRVEDASSKAAEDRRIEEDKPMEIQKQQVGEEDLRALEEETKRQGEETQKAEDIRPAELTKGKLEQEGKFPADKKQLDELEAQYMPKEMLDDERLEQEKLQMEQEEVVPPHEDMPEIEEESANEQHNAAELEIQRSPEEDTASEAQRLEETPKAEEQLAEAETVLDGGKVEEEGKAQLDDKDRGQLDQGGVQSYIDGGGKKKKASRRRRFKEKFCVIM